MCVDLWSVDCASTRSTRGFFDAPLIRRSWCRHVAFNRDCYNLILSHMRDWWSVEFKSTRSTSDLHRLFESDASAFAMSPATIKAVWISPTRNKRKGIVGFIIPDDLYGSITLPIWGRLKTLYILYNNNKYIYNAT